jgi:serine/threonine-protein kinase
MLVGQQLGPFLIEKQLGSGAMGAVYLGRHVELGIKAAIKIMLPGAAASGSAAQRFEREAAILKQLRHPNIVRLYGIGRSGGSRYYAMEYIEGESLDQALARRGRFTWEEVVELGRQLCAALQHAHEQGVVHRDLKPSNLMVLPDGTLKLTDFGIAKDLDVTGLTAANCTVGTAAYMSPEQCKGDPNLSHKSDLYSLGVVFYELLTGRKPFNATNAVDMFMQHVKAKPERPSRIVLDLPVWFDTLVCQLLEKKPDQRPADAATVYAALGSIKEKVEAQQSAGVDAVRSRVLGGGPVVEPGTDETEKDVVRTLWTGKSKSKKRRKKTPFYRQLWFTISSVAGVLLLLAGLLYLVLRPPGPDALYRQAERLMAMGNAEARAAAREPLSLYLHHYGDRDDEQARQMKAWADDVEAGEAEDLLQRYQRRVRQGREKMMETQSEVEELAFKAGREEEAGDLAAAARTWQTIQADHKNTRWAKLAAKRLQQIARLDRLDEQFGDYLTRIRASGRELNLEGPEADAFAAFRAEHFTYLCSWTDEQGRTHTLPGDLALASSRYAELKAKVADDMGQRLWFLLASSRVRALKDRLPKEPEPARQKLLADALDWAEANKAARLLDTRAVCTHVIALYGSEEGLQRHVNRAKRIRDEVAKNIK